MGIAISVLALVLLVACWFVGDLEFRTKVILTLIYLASWVFAFIDGWALLGAQALVAFIVWWATFGPRGR
jgi:hypothetical protein